MSTFSLSLSRAQDRVRWTVPGCLSFATIAWVVSLAHMEGSVIRALEFTGVAFLITGACLAILVRVPLTRNSSDRVMPHALHSLAMCLVIGVTAVTAPKLFEAIWRVLFLSQALFEVSFLLRYWQRLPRAFRLHHTCHRTTSLLLVGAWMASGGPWHAAATGGLALWMTAEAWPASSVLYRRITGSSLSATGWTQTKRAAFWAQRAQRVLAYVFCFLTADPLGGTPLLILFGALALDGLDIRYQWQVPRTPHRPCRSPIARRALWTPGPRHSPHPAR